MDCVQWIAVHIIVDWCGVQQCTIQLSGCWQERRGGTASGLSCCQLNTALIDDDADHDPGDDEDGHGGDGGDGGESGGGGGCDDQDLGQHK